MIRFGPAGWSYKEVRRARAAFDPLLDGGKLGALLLQFPWSFRRTDENREWLDDLLSTFVDLPRVVEVRHDSWSEPATCTWSPTTTSGGKGITNALMLKSMVRKKKVPAPPKLFGEYAEVLEGYAGPGGPPVRPA